MPKGVIMKGDKELIRKLERMNPKLKDTRKAIRPGAKIYQKQARKNVPADSGALKRAIKTKTLKGEPAALAVRPVYTRKENARSGNVTSGYHAHLVEYGTGVRPAVKGGGKRAVNIGGKVVLIGTTGEMPAKPFLRPAWDQTKSAVFNSQRQELWKLVKQLARGR